MADSGTATGSFGNEGHWTVAITGVTQGTTTPAFTLKNSMYSSFNLFGTFGGASVQPQGSDDGGTTWANIGVALTAAGSGTLTPGGVTFRLYRYNVTGGDGTTSLSMYTMGTTPR